MSFRTTLLVAMVALIVGVIGAMAVAVSTVVARSARADVDEGLTHARGVVTHEWRSQQALDAAQVRVLAEEPRLKAVVATQDITPATILGVATEIDRGLDADLFLVLDARGRLLADVDHPGESGADMRAIPVIAGALARGSEGGILADDEAVYRVCAQRLAFGATPVGILVVGQRLDDSFARSIRAMTGASLVLVLGDRVVSSAGDPTAASVARLSRGIPEHPREIRVDGSTYIASAGTLQARPGAAPLRYVVLSSLDAALAPSRQLSTLLYVIAGIALVIGLLIALWLSGALSRPLDRLAALAARVAAGDLDTRPSPTGFRELSTLARALDRMVVSLRESREVLASKERMHKELEIASRLQTALLPSAPVADELTIAARMIPASEVGGDYYDVLPCEDGAWLAIGDVAGHGLPAGIVMMMVRTGVAALVERDPDARPSELVDRLNRLVHQGIRERLRTDEHVTFCALRHDGGGRFRHAGAHEDILVWRRASGRCELFPTVGTWLGIAESIAHVTIDSTLTLEVGDVMVLMTDGAFEARRSDGELLGLAALVEAIESWERVADASPAELLEHLVRFIRKSAPILEDDVTLMIVERCPP